MGGEGQRKEKEGMVGSKEKKKKKTLRRVKKSKSIVCTHARLDLSPRTADVGVNGESGPKQSTRVPSSSM